MLRRGVNQSDFLFVITYFSGSVETIDGSVAQELGMLIAGMLIAGMLIAGRFGGAVLDLIPE